MPSHFPHFIEDKLVYSCNLNISRKQRSKLALVGSLQFYEVNHKQILNLIDLKATVLSKVQYKFDSIDHNINGTLTQASDIFACSKTCLSTPKFGGITIGKYVHQRKNETLIYILIQCWNSLVVIKKNSNGFSLQAEYEEVQSFNVSKESKFQANVSICFLNSNRSEVTNFNEINETSQLVNAPPSQDMYTKIWERIKIKKSELLVHQTMTKKEFAKLKSIDVFGCNPLRTPRLEELQILSKCGNTWIKLTANDDVVIGVPLVNNCSSRLTVLRNFRAVLQGLEDSAYTFKLYQLERLFEDLDNKDSFFNDPEESSDKERYPANCKWEESSDFCLRPEAFGILVLNLKINDAFIESGQTSVSLFAFYDIFISNRMFKQKFLLSRISLGDIFVNDSCRLKFDENNLHRDILTIMASSLNKIKLEFVGTVTIFEVFLCQKLGFSKVFQSQNLSEPMNVDEEENNVIDNEKLILYNKNEYSVWHGTLLEVTKQVNNPLVVELRIFAKSYNKCKVFVKQLRVDLKVNFGIKDVQENMKSVALNLMEFEAALREECSSRLEVFSSSAKDKDRVKRLYKQLHLKKLNTDFVFKNLVS